MDQEPLSETVVIEFSREAYSLDAVKRAAYRFSDRLIVDITTEDRAIRCSVTARVLSDPRTANLIDSFKLEVLDQDLRSTISAETESLRNLILAYAFSKTGLQGE